MVLNYQASQEANIANPQRKRLKLLVKQLVVEKEVAVVLVVVHKVPTP